MSLNALKSKNILLIGANRGLGKIVDQKPMNSTFTNTELIDDFWLISEELFGKF